MEYKEIIRHSARTKLIELAKSFLDIVDELKKEDISKVDKMLAIAEENGLGEQTKHLRPFLFLIDDSKKEIIRKRVLDLTNELIRELEN
jgi:hypothetical protein